MLKEFTLSTYSEVHHGKNSEQTTQGLPPSHLHLMQLQIIAGNGGLNIVENCKIFANLFIFSGARGGAVV